MYKFNDKEFEIISQALADGLAATQTHVFEEVKMFVDNETRMPVDELKDGVSIVADPIKTIQNFKTFYDASKLTDAMLEAGRIITQKKNG